MIDICVICYCGCVESTLWKYTFLQNGCSSIFHAVENGSMDCINLLLRNNVDLTVQDKVVSWTKAMQINKCDALQDLLPSVQFKKLGKHPWRSFTFRLKVTLLYGCFSHSLNCTNSTKLREASQIWICWWLGQFCDACVVGCELLFTSWFTRLAIRDIHSLLLRGCSIGIGFLEILCR